MSFEDMMIFQNDIKAIIIIAVVVGSVIYGLVSLFKKNSRRK